jgi:membrane-associated PAP2 superfamily phosphatase
VKIVRYYLIHFVLPIVAIGLTLVGLEASGFDRAITDYFFDPIAKDFYWRYNWFLEVIMHRWTKYVAMMIAAALLSGFILSFWVETLVKHRRLLGYAVLAMILSSTAISLLKSQSNKHCPWDLKEYGGYAPYTHLLESLPEDIRPGRCFPAGHAATGFCLMTFYFVGRHLGRKKLALAGVVGGFTIGFILGFGRVIQGAHFLSHSLGTALICWLIIALLYEIMLRPSLTPIAVPAS